MKTASFQTYQGPGRISIARFAPRNTPAGYRQFKPLAPASKDMLNMEYEPYRALFFGQLNQLEPREIWYQLHELACGVEPVLLCWEKPPFSAANWCHRRMVAKWFEEHLKIEVPEIGKTNTRTTDLGGRA